MRAIVSLANDNGNYKTALARLEESLKGRFIGNFFGFTSEDQVGAPPHSDNPYAFKLYAMEHVRNLGYTSVLWLDSSCYAVANVEPIFQIIESKGYFMQEAGNWCGNWCNSQAYEYFNLDKETAMKMPMFSAGMTGLNFENTHARIFFEHWQTAMNNGIFRGSWDNFRHDMLCGSVIACRMNLEYQKGDQYIMYGAPNEPLINDSIVIKLQGL